MKNKKKVYFVLVIAFVIIAMVLGYTYSKYAQSHETTVSTAVAKWSFTGKVINEDSTSTISLADTISSGNVSAGNIAPGTSGEFDIVIDATNSEVDLSYDVSLVNETTKPRNLYFTYNGEKYYSVSELLSAVDSYDEKIFSGKFSESDSEKIKTYHVSWNWPYETIDEDGNLLDEIDLEDGQDISDYTFSINIVGTQI